MALSIPETTKQWNVTGTDGFDSLRYSEQPVPEFGDNQVLVKSKLSTFRDLLRYSQNPLTGIHSSWRLSQCTLLYLSILSTSTNSRLSFATSLSPKENTPGVSSLMSFPALMVPESSWLLASMLPGFSLVIGLSQCLTSSI
jgi:hypothetical protein